MRSRCCAVTPTVAAAAVTCSQCSPLLGSLPPPNVHTTSDAIFNPVPGASAKLSILTTDSYNANACSNSTTTV